MPESEEVSVIMPVYNGAPFFRSALETVLNQSSPPLEVIVVDDGSTDDSASVIAHAVAELSHVVPIRLIQQENGGQSAARNAGVSEADGALVAFLDQDDLWHPRHLEQLVRPFSQELDLGWAYCDFDEIDDSGMVVTRNFIDYHKYQHPKTALAQMIRHDIMVLPSASVLRKSALVQVGGFDPRLRGYEDDDLFIRMFRHGWTSHFNPESLTKFRIHTNSSSANSTFRESRMIFFAKLVEQFPDDVRTNRMYITDLVAPRMLTGTIAEYSNALRLKRFAEARSIADNIATLFRARSRMTLLQRFGVGLMRRPRWCRVVLSYRRSLPRFLRPPISPAFILRG